MSSTNATDMSPRVLIFGTGSVGTTYAYLLSRVLPPQNIVTVCRSNYDTAIKNGFIVNSTIWGNNLRFHPTVVKTIDEAAQIGGHFDYVLNCSKALPTQPRIAELLKPVITRHTSIVLIQNGIAIEEEYVKLYGSNPIISAVIYLPVTQTAPGVIEHKEIELLQLGTYPASTDAAHKDAAQRFVELMRSTTATVEYHEDIQSCRWKKLLINASLNPICALTRSRDMQFLSSSEDALPFYKDMMLEIAAVAQAYGYNQINEGTAKWQAGRATTRKPPGVQPSMMADALAGRNMEVEAIVGNLVRLAKAKAVEIPILRTTYVLLRGLDDSFTRSRSEA